VEDPIWDVDGDSKLWPGGWVITFEGFNLVVNADVVDICPWSVEWIWVSIQFKGLSNCPNCILHHACSYLVAATSISLSNPLDEGLYDRNLFFAMQVLKVWLNVGWEKALPVEPIMVPLLVI